MAALTDRTVIVTGAGRGLGREHALLAAREGAAVVVNDHGTGSDGRGSDPDLAAAVVREIEEAGGKAVASTVDVSTLAGAEQLLGSALDAFGRVDGLVNNAGILRDKMFVNMSEEDWQAVVSGHLGATFAPSRVVAAHWREESKAGRQPQAGIVNVSSTSGLLGQVGQTNYGAAKAGIASLTIILAQELGRYGVRVNAITPVARTRMTQDLPGIGEMVAVPSDPEEFDVYHPGNVSPLVAWLLTADCPVTGEVFYAKGGEVRHYRPWEVDWTIDNAQRWSVAELDVQMRRQIAEQD